MVREEAEEENTEEVVLGDGEEEKEKNLVEKK